MQEIHPSQENINMLNKRKASTPSLIFCKSGSKSPQISQSRKSSNRSPMSRSRVSDEHCENHRSKKAHFVKEIDGGCLYFCEKCAIALASQGHTICRVSEGPVGHVGASQRQSTRSPAKQSLSHLPNSRECEISTFVAKLKQLCSTIDSKREQIRDNLLASEQFYGSQIQEINDYFSMVQKSLELQKHKCYNHILRERKKMEQPLRAVAEEVLCLKKETETIVSDIEGNLQTVATIEQNVYNLVISQYADQYNDISGKIIRVPIEEVEMRKIQFAGVPESIYTLSDVVLQSMTNSTKDRMLESKSFTVNNESSILDLSQYARPINSGQYSNKLLSKQAEVDVRYSFAWKGQDIEAKSPQRSSGIQERPQEISEKDDQIDGALLLSFQSS